MSEKPILCVKCKRPTGMQLNESLMKNVVVHCASCNTEQQNKRRQALLRNHVPALLWEQELLGG